MKTIEQLQYQLQCLDYNGYLTLEDDELQDVEVLKKAIEYITK